MIILQNTIVIKETKTNSMIAVGLHRLSVHISREYQGMPRIYKDLAHFD